jgi:hypothetical protein
MEPLQDHTPLLVALLCRVHSAAASVLSRSAAGRSNQQKPSPLRAALQPTHELSRLQLFIDRVARVYDSNLIDRRSELDIEQYAEAVRAQEEERLGLFTELQEILEDINTAISGSTKQNHLFLIPIEDIDLNPDRCRELLRVVRSLSVIKYFFFMLAGDLENVGAIHRESFVADHIRIAGHCDTERTRGRLQRRRIDQIALANLRKVIPLSQVVELRSYSWREAKDYTPLFVGGETNG